MAAVVQWRTQQERELHEDRGGGMSAAGVVDFVRYFERLTRHGLATLPMRADVVVTLDDLHGVAEVCFNRGGIRES